MDTIEAADAADTIDDLSDAALGGDTNDEATRGATWYLRIAVFAVLGLFAVFLLATQEKAQSTLVLVVGAVGTCAAIWIGANLLFNEVRERWQRFLTIAMAAAGAFLGVLLHGNQLTLGSGSGFLTWVVGPLVGAAVFGAIGFVMATTDSASSRLTIGVASGAAIGVAIGALIRSELHPGLDPLAIVIYTCVGVGIGAGISALRKKPPIGGAILGGAIGWIAGAWGGADLGDGSIVESIIASIVPALAIGFLVGRSRNPDYQGRASIDLKSRAVIFLAPALTFILIMLVVPTIRTMYLSLLDRESEDFVGLENYGAVFSDPTSWQTASIGNFFTSQLTWIGGVLLVIALIIGINMKQRTGRAVEIGNPTVAPLVVGAMLVAFGLFTSLRGTIANNLWWVVTVTTMSTVLGLAVAVLADNKRGERVAKAIIFMPMAISLVGASIIWRFVYQARDVSKEQTGIINALWTSLGKLSTGSGLPTLIGSIVLGLITVIALAFLAQALTSKSYGRAAVPAVLTLAFGWLFLKYAGIVGKGLGGFEVDPVFQTDPATGEPVLLTDPETGAESPVIIDTVLSGEPETVFFVQDGPWNNVFLMIILIWIQTGFAMVILSAAIKAVPTELIEAARIDGATESQVFWRVTLPQISTTIGVVVTTIVVLVMKVFDIVKVTTNGQFDTQVLANDMFNTAFLDGNTGKGAALAILIFVSVLPVMVFNIRRMQKED